jgi:hypothetical protein
MEEEYTFADISSHVYNNGDVEEAEEMIAYGRWIDRDKPNENSLIRIAVRNNNIPMLDMFTEYFDFQIDRRPLMALTNNMETIRWLDNLGYDRQNILEKVYDNVARGDDTDLRFYLDNLDNLTQEEMDGFLDDAAGFEHILAILQEYNDRLFGNA